jgi:hypothetical protein
MVSPNSWTSHPCHGMWRVRLVGHPASQAGSLSRGPEFERQQWLGQLGCMAGLLGRVRFHVDEESTVPSHLVEGATQGLQGWEYGRKLVPRRLRHAPI